jgi:tRNA(His) guanylyltransferase
MQTTDCNHCFHHYRCWSLAVGRKINSSIVSHFSSCYIFHWLEYMGADTPLQYVPSFDSRVVLYPTDRALRDYLSWRQVDCHINNLYNTCFWALVERAGHSQRQAEKILKVSCREHVP